MAERFEIEDRRGQVFEFEGSIEKARALVAAGEPLVWIGRGAIGGIKASDVADIRIKSETKGTDDKSIEQHN